MTVGPVGYGKPPTASRFQKGTSGNPRGRKKGGKNLKTDVLEELQEVISVQEGGRTRKMSKQRALVKSLMTRALKADPRAVAQLIGLVLRVADPAEVPVALRETSPLDREIIAQFLARNITKKGDA